MMVQEGGTPARQCCSRVRWSRMALHPGTGLQTGFYAHAGQSPQELEPRMGAIFKKNTGFQKIQVLSNDNAISGARRGHSWAGLGVAPLALFAAVRPAAGRADAPVRFATLTQPRIQPGVTSTRTPQFYLFFRNRPGQAEGISPNSVSFKSRQI